MLYRLRSRFQSRKRRDAGEEIRISDHILLLNLAVIALRGKAVCQRETIVKNAEARPDNGLRPGILAACSRRPRDGQARREIPPVIGEFVVIAPEAMNSKDMARHIMECHRRLAEIPGPQQNAFAAIAQQMARELEQRV